MSVTVTLRYQDKEYTFVDSFEYTPWLHSDGTVARTSFEAAEYIYTEGNYGCDCNKSAFLVQHCGVDFQGHENAIYEYGEWTLNCGNKIELFSLNDTMYVNDEPVAKRTEFLLGVSGLYLPVEVNR